MKAVRDLLTRVRGRMIRERALTAAAMGAAVAALGTLFSQAAVRHWPFEPFWPVLLAWVTLGLVIALVSFRRALPSSLEVARLADLRLGGKDRLVTALEFGAEGGWMYQVQRRDASAFAGGASLDHLGPLRVPKGALTVAALAAIGAVLLALLPNPALQQLRQQKAAAAAQAHAADQVQVVARQAAGQARPGEDPAKRQALAQDLKKAADSARKAQDPQAALASLSQAQDKLRELQDPSLGAKQDAAAGAGGVLAKNPQSAQAGDALSRQDMQAASSQLDNLAKSLPSLNQQQRQQLSDSLAQASSAAGGDPKLQQSLKSASDSLKQGDVEAAQQALQAAAQEAQSVGAQENFQGDVNQAINGLQQAKAPVAQQASGQQGQQGESGQGQQGQGLAPGQGQGQGQAQGQGQGRGQNGSTGSSAGGAGAGANGSGGGSGSAASNPQAGSEKVFVPGQAQGTSGNGTPEGSGQGVQNDLVPYQQVIAQYQSAALSQVDRADIPQQQRQLVQQYFNDLSK